MSRPLLKYPGGKAKLAKRILGELYPHGPPGEHMALDAFAGGASITLALAGVDGAAVLSNDINQRIYRAYVEVQGNPGRVRNALIELEGRFHEDRERVYYACRDQYNSTETGAEVLLLLNSQGFNGLYRENRSGGYNVSLGESASGEPTYYDLDKLSSWSEATTNVVFSAGQWWRHLPALRRGDRAYFDPPYVPDRKGGFQGYVGAFGLAEQRLLSIECQDLARRGIRFAVSNHNVPAIREIWDDLGFDVQELDVRRSIGRSDGKAKAGGEPKGRFKAKEVLIVGGPDV